MKTIRFLPLLLIILIACNSVSSDTQESPADPFIGSWALTLDYESSSAGWFDIRQEDGYLDADVLWRWGSVYPADFIFVDGVDLFITKGRKVVREKDEDGNPLRTHQAIFWFNVQVNEDGTLTGTANFPNQDGIGVETAKIEGKKIPPVGPAPDLSELNYGEPVELLNGKDLSGWELIEKSAVNGWKVADGVLVNDAVQKEGEEHIRYGNLRTTETFEDFNLKLEVNVPEGSNSGIYLRGIYEVQVMDSYGRDLDSHNMGALYSRITPLVAAEKPAGEWQEMDITLCNRYLTVILNGQKIIDNQPVGGVTGGAMTSDEFSPGPIFLQGDHGKVSYRNIVLTPIVE